MDEIFDDASFSKLPSDKVVFAAYAREFFKWTEKHKLPSPVEYLIWRDAFVSDTFLVEIPPAEIPDEVQPATATTTPPATSPTTSPAATLPKNKTKSGKTEKKTQPKKKKLQRDGMTTIDKIRRIVDWAEKTMMPPPGSPWAEIAEFREQLFTATQVIKTYPTSFLTHPEFLKLIELGQKQIADEEKYPFRLTASLPVTDLRKTIYGTVNVNDKNVDDSKLKRNLTLTEKRKAEAKLRLLPLPVTIERHPEITGTNEEIMVFNWFRCAGPEQAKEVVKLIPKFFLVLIEGLDELPEPDNVNIVNVSR